MDTCISVEDKHLYSQIISWAGKIFVLLNIFFSTFIAMKTRVGKAFANTFKLMWNLFTVKLQLLLDNTLEDHFPFPSIGLRCDVLCWWSSVLTWMSKCFPRCWVRKLHIEHGLMWSITYMGTCLILVQLICTKDMAFRQTFNSSVCVVSSSANCFFLIKLISSDLFVHIHCSTVACWIRLNPIFVARF